MIKRERLLRYIFEFLISLNVALAIVWEKSSLSPFFLEVMLQYRINGYLNLNPHSNLGGFVAMFGLALGLALGIFIVFRLLSLISMGEEFIRPFEGILALVAIPACWLYVNYELEHLSLSVAPGVQQSSLFWPFLEFVLAILCALLYLYKKWPIPPWAGIVLLSLHWIFWGWRLFGPFFWARPPFLIFPIVGFCSSLMWGIYGSFKNTHRHCRGNNI